MTLFVGLFAVLALLLYMNIKRIIMKLETCIDPFEFHDNY